jgi:hypothetical protein
MPCRRYKNQDSAHELAMSPLNLSRVLSMAVNPLDLMFVTLESGGSLSLFYGNFHSVGEPNFTAS